MWQCATAHESFDAKAAFSISGWKVAWTAAAALSAGSCQWRRIDLARRLKKATLAKEISITNTLRTNTILPCFSSCIHIRHISTARAPYITLSSAYSNVHPTTTAAGTALVPAATADPPSAYTFPVNVTFKPTTTLVSKARNIRGTGYTHWSGTENTYPNPRSKTHGNATTPAARSNPPARTP